MRKGAAPLALSDFRMGPLETILSRDQVDKYLQTLSCPGLALEPPATLPPAAASLYLAVVMGALLEDPGSGVTLARLIHLEQSYAFLEPVAVGEPLYLEGWVASVQERRGQTFFTVVMEGRKSPGGPLALSGTSRLLLRKEEEAE